MIGLEVLLIFVAVSLMTYWLVTNINRRRFNELAAKLPGNEGFLFLVSIFMVLKTSRKNYLSKIISYAKEGAPMTKLWLLNQLLIITKDADFINKVFTSNQTYNKPDVFYQSFMLKKGLIVMTGNDHKRHRKVLTKAFTSKMLQRLPEIFDEKSKKVIKLFEEQEDCGEFELMEYIGTFSFETFGKSNLNYEIDYFQSDIYEAYEQYSSLMVDALPYLMVGFSPKLLELTKTGKSIKKVFEKFHKFVDDSVSANHRNNNFVENTAIDLLLDPKNGFDDDEIKEEIILMLLGAFETSTRIISTVLMMLGMHKNVQDKLMKEIEEICSHETDIKFSNDFLQKFSYLDMVIKETMRLFTVVPMVARTTSEEVDINGYLLPKGAIILIMLHAMHREKKYWGDDAEIFRPERFEEYPTNPHAFAPFTGGSRICIGYRYAMSAMKVFLINFLRTYRVDCSTKFEDLRTEMILTLNILNGYKISIFRK